MDLDTTALLVTGSVSGLMSKEGQDEDDNGDPFEFLSFSLSYSLACLQMGGEDRLSERGARIGRLLFDYPQAFSSLVPGWALCLPRLCENSCRYT